MTTPKRLQMRRQKGFRLQVLSHSHNGLPAKLVTRGTPWGNPFAVESHGVRVLTLQLGITPILDHRRLVAVDLYRRWLDLTLLDHYPSALLFFPGLLYPVRKQSIRVKLCGYNLACFCGPDGKHTAVEPYLTLGLRHSCHADVLLELANR